MSNGEIVIACYKPKEGKQTETVALATGHFNVLKGLGFVTNRDPVVFQSKDSTVIEIFEWASSDAFKVAHDHPEVAAYWEKMAQVCTFVPPGSIIEMQKSFSHFKPIQ